ncbi:MAG: GspH/FimT family pseudopilin [Gammaproteobacteria bacterium]|nr:GspH/FimT family pseudopilin [Gammaproteobacteria bacterium]
MHKFQHGLTLLELMVVLVIAGIALSAAVPSFQGMIARNQVATRTNDLLLAINLARSEAIRISGGAFVAAVDGSDASDEFGPGWCVVLDTADCGAGDVIRTFEPLPGGNTFDAVEDVTSLEFDGLGALVDTGALPRQFDLCSDEAAGRRVFVSLIGRAKSHGPDDQDTSRRPDC